MTRAPAAGILLSNLGTPEAPDAPALRRFLREFLGDPRVVDLPRALWWPILNLFILPFRPAKSARLYKKVWTAEGSPLMVFSKRLAFAVEQELSARQGEGTLAVELGMRYGEPSIGAALRRLRERGCRRILVLPLYPQYSSSTGGSTLDAVAAEFRTWRNVPDLRVVESYHAEPPYISEVATSLSEAWKASPAAERLVFSFHGLPKRWVDQGEVYEQECRTTAALVASRLGLADDRFVVSFQSRFGREEWIGPATDETLRSLASKGIRSVDVVCPGFSVDCLETLEEIAMLNRGIFLGAGGTGYRYVAALNDRPGHAAALAAILEKSLAGWIG